MRKKEKNSIRKLWVFLVIILIVCIGAFVGIRILNTEVVLQDDAETYMNDLLELQKFVTGEASTDPADTENPYDLESYISALSTTEVIGFYTPKSTTITCKITAPDVYSYLIENEDVIFTKETDEIYQEVIAYLSSENCPVREREIVLSARYENGTLYADTNRIEYKDAVSGGLYSAIGGVMDSIYLDDF